MEATENTKTRPAGRRRFAALAAALLLLVAVWGLWHLLWARYRETTEDAYLEGNVVIVSPKVAGHVVRLLVEDNQPVQEGQLLAEIDPRDYIVRVDQARAALEAAEARQRAALATTDLTRTTSGAGLALADAGVETAQAAEAVARMRTEQAGATESTAAANASSAEAQVAAAEAEATRATADAVRFRTLFARDEVSRQQLERAEAAEKAATATLKAAHRHAEAAASQIREAQAAREAALKTLAQAGAAVREARARQASARSAPQQVATSAANSEAARAELDRLRAALRQAQLDLAQTRIVAPQAGSVTRRAVEKGTFVVPGQALLAIVPSQTWVVANFKETQLTWMCPGQRVDIEVDAYPDMELHGRVQSIQRGTGARFSLLPPENATGNFVKVVQRVPVKIVLEGRTDPSRPLAPGMSVVPTVILK